MQCQDQNISSTIMLQRLSWLTTLALLLIHSLVGWDALCNFLQIYSLILSIHLLSRPFSWLWSCLWLILYSIWVSPLRSLRHAEYWAVPIWVDRLVYIWFDTTREELGWAAVMAAAFCVGLVWKHGLPRELWRSEPSQTRPWVHSPLP